MKRSNILLIIIGLLFIPSIVLAKYFDTITSPGNSFSATTLDSAFYTSPNEPTFKLEPDIEYSFDAKLINTGKLESVNSQEMVKITDPKMASVIFVVVYIDGNGYEKGYLDKIDLSKFLEQSSGAGNAITYTFSISKEDYINTAGRDLTFVIRNYAGQVGFAKNTGFHDSEDIVVRLINPLEVRPVPTPRPSEAVLVPIPLESSTASEFLENLIKPEIIE